MERRDFRTLTGAACLAARALSLLGVPLWLAACATTQMPPAPLQPLPPAQFGSAEDDVVWMRVDGQRMTGNFALQQQFFQAQHECTDNNRQPAEVSEDCMRTKGYISGSRPAF